MGVDTYDFHAASRTGWAIREVMRRLPTGFIVPAQPVLASRPPVATDWVHEIKHDGYRMIVRRDGPTVRLYSRNAYDWSARLSAIAAAARQIKAKSFTIDGEAVVPGPDGLSLFDELRRREAAHAAILYAFDLIEYDGEDMRNLPFLDRKNALARLLSNTEAGIVLSEHIAGDGPSRRPAGWAQRASPRRRSKRCSFRLGRKATRTRPRGFTPA
jgi:ATP-dependent DNA ligase